MKCYPVTRENQHELRVKTKVIVKKPRFGTGDKVRISIEKHKLSKGYFPNYSTEIFTVSRVLKNRFPSTYKIKDNSGEEIEGIFYNEELVKVQEGNQPVRKIRRLIKTERRKRELWHQVWFENAKKPSWIRNDALVSI